MRHEELRKVEAFDIVELAEAWPDCAAELPAVREPVMGAPSVPDMPAAAGIMMIAVYAGLMGIFALTIAHDAPAGFAVAIGVFFIAMFFAVPAVFLSVEQDGSRRPSLSAFMERGIDTATGRISGAGALVQMLVVPVLLAFGVLAIGVITLVI